MLTIHPTNSTSSKPRLTEKQLAKQLKLLNGSVITHLDSPFEDSSHDVYLIQEANASPPSSVAKVLKPEANNANRFWQLMQDCFNANLISQTACFYALYPLIKDISPLHIPGLKQQIIEPADPDKPKKAELYVSQAHFLQGEPVKAITPEMVQDLAKHVACLHLTTSNHFGSVDKPICNRLNDWRSHLARVIQSHMQKHPDIQPPVRQRLLDQIQTNFYTENFCLIMPDLRWDQFLTKEGRLFALTDLDAIVYGPKELEWTLLEYLLSPTQAKIFLEEYTQFLSVPDLTDVRDVYRVLLYMMNVLGETDFDAWMKQSKLFNLSATDLVT